MNKDVFFDIEGLGSLYLDYIFFEFESEPVIFTCTNPSFKLYLCLCSEIRYGQRWILTECNIYTLRMLIEGKLDLKSALLFNETVYEVNMDLQGNETCRQINSTEIDDLDLPMAGTPLREFSL